MSADGSGRTGTVERDIEQAITALKKGAYLLKYGRRGKPKFCPFRLSNDESVLIWYSGKEEKQLKLSHVSRIMPGQRTAIFQRYPRPERECQSFSLIYNDRSLDLICKDKDEAEVWFAGLRALISRSHNKKWRVERRSDGISSGTTSPRTYTRRSSPLSSPFGSDNLRKEGSGLYYQSPHESPPKNSPDKAFSDVLFCSLPPKAYFPSDSTCASIYSMSSGASDGLNVNTRGIPSDNYRVENLTRKTLLQGVDLERTTKQLKEAVAIAGEETAKCKAAKEVIKSLTAQLKDMAERLPIGASKSNKLTSLANLSTNFALSDTSFSEVVQQCSPVPTNNTDLNGSNGLLLSDGQNSINLNQPVPTRAVRNGGKLNDTDANHEPTEWVEQDHPGVYITLTSLPGGVKDLKRVRFSRKRFSEKQAEKWWAENRVRVYQQYNVRMVDKSVVGIPNNVATI